MSTKAIMRQFAVGQTVDVTNHYISRQDHPCFGTRRRTVTAVTGSSVLFDVGGRLRWKADRLRAEQDDGGDVRVYGHPDADALFLTIAKAEGGAK